MKVLAGDIGGTHARFAIVEVSDAGARIVREATVPSRGAPALAPLIVAFLRDGDQPARACLAVPGPVRDGEARTTNLPWTIRVSDLAAATGLPVTMLINDFEAVGHGLRLLGPADLVTLQAGEPVEHGPIALIGAGTGLGQGFLIWNGSGYQVHPSEGGHATFAAQRDVEWGLFGFLARRFGQVSWERIVSGPGLVQVYEYLAANGTRTASDSVREEMQHDDPAAVITRHGVAGTDQVAVEALDLFVGAWGAQAGNLALTVLATGGVFLAGGIAPRILDRLKTTIFLDPFRQKGRLEPVLAKVPVHVIVNPDVGLLGAAAVAATEQPQR